MLSTQALSLIALGLLSPVLGANLLVSHFSGQIYSLSLSESSGNRTLSVTSSTAGCGRLPAWLQLDPKNDTVYCIDENWSGPGNVSSFSVATDGSLTQTGKSTTAGMSVHGMFYGGNDGRGFFATAE